MTWAWQLYGILFSHIESLGSMMLNIPRSFAYSKVVSLGKDTTMTWAWQTIIQQLWYVCQMVNGFISRIESLRSTMLNILRSFAYSKVVSLGKDTTMTWAWQTTTLQYEFL